MTAEVSEKVGIVDSLEDEKEELRSRVYQKTEEQFSREQDLLKKVVTGFSHCCSDNLNNFESAETCQKTL